MIPTTLLVTRPEYDYTTRYISAWAGIIIDFASNRNHLILDLKKERALRIYVESMLKKQKPSLIFLNGHGNEQSVTGQDGEVLIEADGNEGLLKEKVIYALSCRSAKILGPKSVVKGAHAYIGYEEDFIFMFSNEKRTKPIEDKTAELFLAPSNQVIISLLKGHKVSEAHATAKKHFIRNIQKLLTSSSEKSDSSAVRYLIWDMRSLVYHGKGNYSL